MNLRALCLNYCSFLLCYYACASPGLTPGCQFSLQSPERRLPSHAMWAPTLPLLHFEVIFRRPALSLRFFYHLYYQTRDVTQKYMLMNSVSCRQDSLSIQERTGERERGRGMHYMPLSSLSSNPSGILLTCERICSQSMGILTVDPMKESQWNEPFIIEGEGER